PSLPCVPYLSLRSRPPPRSPLFPYTTLFRSLQSANCGFEVPWSAPLKARHAGSALKPVAITFTDTRGQVHCRQGELVVSEYGLEGSLIYAFSKWLRAAISESGSATLHLDLVPGHSAERVAAELARPRGARSVSSHLQSRLGLKGVKAALLREGRGAEGDADRGRAAAARMAPAWRMKR